MIWCGLAWRGVVRTEEEAESAKLAAAQMMVRVVRRMERTAAAKAWGQWRDVVAWQRQAETRQRVSELAAQMSESQKAHGLQLLDQVVRRTQKLKLFAGFNSWRDVVVTADRIAGERASAVLQMERAVQRCLNSLMHCMHGSKETTACTEARKRSHALTVPLSNSGSQYVSSPIF